jgi:jasmonate ZIM domain-containing protein
MSSTAPVELDFLGLRRTVDHRGTTASSIRGRRFIRSSSSDTRRRELTIHLPRAGMRTSAIASIGAQQLRRVIVGSAEQPTPAPTMTVFYNGAVATFHDVSQDKASLLRSLCSNSHPEPEEHRDKAYSI